MYFLELWQEPALHSRVTVGMILQSSCLLNEVSTPVRFQRTTQESHEAWQGNTDTSPGEVGDRASL